MLATEIESLVTGIVDRRFETFRQEIDMELLPIKLAIKTHEEQIGEIRSNGNATREQLSRMEGKSDAFIEEMRQNHLQNASLIQRFTEHLGEHAGAANAETELEREQQQAADHRREWVKIGVGVATSGGLMAGLFKWLHDHWGRWHLK